MGCSSDLLRLLQLPHVVHNDRDDQDEQDDRERGTEPLLALPQLFHGLGPVGFGLVLAGGIVYTVGALVYACRRPDPWPRVFGFHEVFHALTLVAAGLQLAAIAFTVVPQ